MTQSKVLFIGDDAQVLEHIKANLSQKGYGAVSAGNIEQALDVLSRNRFPVVFIDLSMLALDGLSLCSWIRRFNKESAMVALCGEHCNPSECLASGFDEVLKWPFSVGEMIEVVKRAINECDLTDPPLAGFDHIPPSRIPYRGENTRHMDRV